MTSPMLAFKWQDKKKHMPFPCHVQPKLNGVRCQFQNGIMQSRSHGLEEPKFWHPNMLQHIRVEIEHIPPHIMLDGEIYLHGWSLQKINGAGGVNRLEPNDLTIQLEYHIFDMFDENCPDLQFDYRRVMLQSLGLWTGPAKLVQTYLALDEPMMETYYALFKSLGYEGAMIRNSTSPYGQPRNCTNKENRWNYLLKRKDWLDAEFEILDFVPTEGKKGEPGFQFVCKAKNGRTFNVGSGITDLQALEFAKNPPIGQFATVKYETLSDAGIPLKPTILLIHD